MIKNMKKRSDGIDFRSLETGDISAVCDFLCKTNAAIDGIKSSMVYRAVCKDALLKRDAIVVVSFKDRELAGCTVALIDRKSYWWLFLLRHPLIAPYVVISTIALKIRTAVASDKGLTPRSSYHDERISGDPSGKTWAESSPSIAKIMHIAVTDTSRNAGIGKGLYEILFEILAGCGVRRVDANIALDNVPSIKLHLATGWHVERAARNFFATIDMP